MGKQIAQQQGLSFKKKKSRFNALEDRQLKSLVEKHGTRNWYLISSLMSHRNPRQCKERWENYLSSKVDQSVWTKEEDNLLIQKRNEIGSHWMNISLFFQTEQIFQLRIDETFFRNRFMINL
jgi:alpha-D-ribose 1-methylphosphonate 5-triphosphate diphosphatase PhnM